LTFQADFHHIFVKFGPFLPQLNVSKHLKLLKTTFENRPFNFPFFEPDRAMFGCISFLLISINNMLVIGEPSDKCSRDTKIGNLNHWTFIVTAPIKRKKFRCVFRRSLVGPLR